MDEQVEGLIPDIYDQLRALARRMMGSRPAGQTLQATALVHEAWLRLAQRGVTPSDRGHLVALASRAIRQVVVDHARARGRIKRAGDRQRVALDSGIGVTPEPGLDLLALDEALEELARFGPEQARIVELRFFGGLTMQEIADLLGCSKRKVENGWAAARAWLAKRLEASD